MRRTFLSVFLVSLWAMAGLHGCKPEAAAPSPGEQARRDSLALHVAVMPVTDCLPLIHAVGSGITDSLGLDVRLCDYLAQMDVDTALQRGHVEVAYSDLIRALRMMSATPVKAFMEGGRTPMAMVALSSGRVKKAHQLKERMVALSRLSVSDYWCDAMLDSAFMVGEDVYRPQVHDVQLRTDMLRTGLVDAAMLPSPYSRWMERTGHKVVALSAERGPHMAAWLVRTEVLADTFRLRQVGLLVEAVAIVCRQLAGKEDGQILRSLMSARCGVPGTVADSMRLDLPTRPALPDTAAVGEAVRFLRRRDRLPGGARPDSLLPDSTMLRMIYRYEKEG